jgi:hypothetical protein
MATLMQAPHQWATRPADQRFTSLTDLNEFCHSVKDHSVGKVLSSRTIELQPVEGDHKALVCVGPNGGAVDLTHWSFGQLAQRAGAPAGYLRTLPSEIVADNLNYGLQYSRNIEDIGVLLHKSEGLPAQLRAVTGPNYGRIWNATITQSLVDRFGSGIDGDFRVPGEFGKTVDITNANTTLYASDRDMFVFLADEKNRITMPNRRDGKSGDLARGFFVWNSEVGSSTFGIATFLFDYVCCNRIVWGAQLHSEVRIRHTASASDRWIEEIVPAIESYANSSTTNVVQAIEQARSARIDNIDEFLAKRFTKNRVSAIKAAHMNDEQRPIETLWDAATGITAYARGIQYQDERVELEREAGRILDMAH